MFCWNTPAPEAGPVDLGRAVAFTAVPAPALRALLACLVFLGLSQKQSSPPSGVPQCPPASSVALPRD